MKQSQHLAIEVAAACREQLELLAANSAGRDAAVQCALSLCRNLERRVDKWPETRLHRALGFIQGVLVARGASSYHEQMALVDNFKVAFPEDADEELLEHWNPRSPFRLDLGGQG